MTLDLISFDAALKELYTDQVVQDMVYKKNPFFALVPKDEGFYGDGYPQPIKYGNPQSRSATFSRAQARSLAENTKLKKFFLTRVHDYCIATIDNETMEASENNKGAFMKAATTEIDGAIGSLTRSVAIALYGNGYGAIGRIATSSFAVTTLTLTQIQDITNFEVGMELDLAVSDSSGTLKAYGSSGNGLIITGVNRSAGTLTFGFNVNDATNGIPTIAVNDYIFPRGDRQNAASPDRLRISGLDGWLPTSNPTSSLFFGVDRTSDVTRLGGLRLDISALPIEEGVIECAALVGREGGSPSHMFINHGKYSDLEKALGSKVVYSDHKVGNIGFRGIRVIGPNGDIDVIPDQNCPYNKGYMLQLDTWTLRSLGKAIKVINSDGLKMLRQATADGVEIRYGGYFQLGCEAPGWNLAAIM